jgi:alanyl-tRNA synthetase
MSFVMSAGLAQVERSTAQQGGRTGERYALLQNCFRYFDLDTVGESPIHLTLFQMPGAFTFKSIDKQTCMAQIWELLTKEYGFPPESLWVTYFNGGEISGHHFEADTETRQAWQEVGMPSNRLVGLGPEHNFWKQGSSVVGEREAPKCGPNTEVFFDRGIAFACGPECAPSCRCGRFIEIQNTLLITEHIDDNTGIVRPLEEPFIEVVVGTERVAMLSQGRESVFEIDSIAPLIKHVRQAMQIPILPVVDQTTQKRILIDHLRAMLFLTADGAPPPGRGGRARLMRKLARGIITSHKLLQIEEPGFVDSLLDLALELYGDQQPQLPPARQTVLTYLADERAMFENTLQRGKRRLERLLRRQGNHISGEDMVNLEKEHGLPEPLLEVFLARRQVPFSRQAYQNAYKNWYQRVTS